MVSLLSTLSWLLNRFSLPRTLTHPLPSPLSRTLAQPLSPLASRLSYSLVHSLSLPHLDRSRSV